MADEPIHIETTIFCDLKHSSAPVYVYVKASFEVSTLWRAIVSSVMKFSSRKNLNSCLSTLKQWDNTAQKDNFELIYSSKDYRSKSCAHCSDVNSKGYSEFEYPIRTRVQCYPFNNTIFSLCNTWSFWCDANSSNLFDSFVFFLAPLSFRDQRLFSPVQTWISISFASENWMAMNA